MKQRPIGDRAGKVRRPATAGGEGHVETVEATLVVEADLVVDHEVVALAGDHHVVVAIGASLGGAAGLLRHDGTQAGEQVALGLLAAEAATHAADLDRHGVGGHVQHFRHHVLDLGRVLGRGVDRDLVVLAGHGQGDLPLEIEMFLAADTHPPGQAPWCSGDGGLGVAAPQRQRVGDQDARRQRRLGVQNGRQFLVFDDGEPGGAARLVAGGGGDGEDRLTDKLDEVGGKQGLVVAVGRADIVLARDVGCGQPQTTPSAARTGSTSTLVIRACALVERPSWMCSRPADSGRSSM